MLCPLMVHFWVQDRNQVVKGVSTKSCTGPCQLNPPLPRCWMGLCDRDQHHSMRIPFVAETSTMVLALHVVMSSRVCFQLYAVYLQPL